MWIETVTDKNGNTSYKYVERYEHPYIGKTHKVSVTMDSQSAQTKKKAAKMLQEKIDKKIASTGDKKVERLTLKEIMDEWLRKQTLHWKPSTARRKQEFAKYLLKRIDHNTLISRIDKVFVKNLFDSMLYDEELAFNYVSELRTVLNQTLEYACEYEYIQYNPVKDIRLPKPKTDFTYDKYLSKEEAEKIWNYYYKTNNRNTKFGYICEFMFYTGLRIGEVMALQVKDFDGQNIKVSGTVDYNNPDIISKGTPKTQASYRTISLPIQALNIIHEIMADEKLKLDDEEAFLFLRKGKFISVASFNISLKNVAKKCGINKKVSSHWFRHSHITMLAELGIPLKAIMDRVGHTNPNTTLQIYNHVTQKQKNDIAEKLNAM